MRGSRRLKLPLHCNSHHSTHTLDERRQGDWDSTRLESGPKRLTWTRLTKEKREKRKTNKALPTNQMTRLTKSNNPKCILINKYQMADGKHNALLLRRGVATFLVFSRQLKSQCDWFYLLLRSTLIINRFRVRYLVIPLFHSQNIAKFNASLHAPKRHFFLKALCSFVLV